MCAFVKYTQFHKSFAFISNLIGLLLVLFLVFLEMKMGFGAILRIFCPIVCYNPFDSTFLLSAFVVMHKCAHRIHLSFVFGDQVMLVFPVSEIKRKALRKPNVDLSNIRGNLMANHAEL